MPNQLATSLATYYCFCSEKGCNGNLEKPGELNLLPDLR